MFCRETHEHLTVPSRLEPSPRMFCCIAPRMEPDDAQALYASADYAPDAIDSMALWTFIQMEWEIVQNQPQRWFHLLELLKQARRAGVAIPPRRYGLRQKATDWLPEEVARVVFERPEEYPLSIVQLVEEWNTNQAVSGAIGVGAVAERDAWFHRPA